MGLRIGVDMDGPVYQFEKCLWVWKNRKLRAHGEIPPVPQTQTWNFFEEPGWDATLEDYLKWCNEASAAGHLFNSQPPHPGAVQGIKALKERGHTIHIMTYRMFPGAIANTAAFIEKWDIPFDTISWTKDKTLVPVDIMIEDNVGNAEALHDAGVIAVIVDRPWNQEWQGYRVGDLNGPRENDWSQFIDFVDLITETDSYFTNGPQ